MYLAGNKGVQCLLSCNGSRNTHARTHARKVPCPGWDIQKRKLEFLLAFTLLVCDDKRNLSTYVYITFQSLYIFRYVIFSQCRSHWPRGLRRRSAAARLLRLWVRIPPGSWMFFCCECCVLSGRGLCDWLITRPEESYRLWCVAVCVQETSSRMNRPWPALGCSAIGKKNSHNA